MPAVTIYIAHTLTSLSTGGYSKTGHIWIGVTDSNGQTQHFGFAPVAHSDAYGPGKIFRDDNVTYNVFHYTRTIQITDDQYNRIIDFAHPNTSSYEGSTYDGVFNNCVDFVWDALDAGGLNPDGIVPDAWPGNNVNDIDKLRNPDLNIPPINPAPPFLPPWLGGPADGFDHGPTGLSPLVLDLDGDGVEVSKLGWGVGASATYFDMDNDGFAERTAWAMGGDGILVRDLNTNGIIDNQNEMFGATATYADGFAKLAALDSNFSGAITSADNKWNTLRVWVDADSDGVTDAGELKTLASLGITKINLNPTAVYDSVNENRISHTGTFVMNGVNRAVSDVWFNTDQRDSYSSTSVTLDVRTLFLPTLKGFGNLEDLHVAMSRNEDLLDLVQDFVTNWDSAQLGDQTALDAAITAILYKWADVETTPIVVYSPQYGGPGPYEAREFAFMEKLTGNIRPLSHYSWNESAVFQTYRNAYQHAFASLKAHLILQTDPDAFFDTPAVYNIATGAILPGTLSAAALAMLADKAEASADSAQYWKAVVATLLEVKEAGAYTSAEVAMLNTAIQSSAPALSWAALAADVYDDVPGFTIRAGYIDYPADFRSHHLTGSNTDDTLEGSNRNDYFEGRSGNDFLYGADGNDILDGGYGDDTLHGGRGDDTYIYTSGHDSITENTGTDVLRITGIYVGSDITFQRVTATAADVNKLNVLIQGQHLITISAHFAENGALETILLDNGTSINIAALADVVGTSGNDVLNGADHALLKEDAIYGGDGNDTINGKLGNDRLEGGAGDDTYIYNSGSGTDTLSDYSYGANADVISFGSGYTSSNISFVRSGQYDLLIKSGASTLIVIKDQFASPSFSIETVKFSNATTINLLTYSHTVNGTAGDDLMYGTSYGAGGDVLNGGNGADTLYGEDGNDTLDGGSGNDFLYGGAGNDLYKLDSANDLVTEYEETGIDTVQIGVAYTLTANVEKGLLTGSSGVSLTGNTLDNELTGNGGINTLTGGDGADIIYGNGNTDYLWGGIGTDTLYGGSGNDVMHGEAGNDTLTGGTGNDDYYGEAGNDILIMDEGTDEVWGGADADVFKFASTAMDGSDYIRDYTASQNDVINVKDLLFGYDPLTSLITNFVEMTNSGANTIMRIDRDGTGTSYTWAQAAQIDSVTGMTDEQALLNTGKLIAA